MKQLFVEAKETHTIKHRINVTGISPTKIDDLLNTVIRKRKRQRSQIEREE